MRYRTDITTSSLKVAESRSITDLLLLGVDDEAWRTALFVDNGRGRMTTKRLRTLTRRRLKPMGSFFWELVSDEQHGLRCIQVAP